MRLAILSDLHLTVADMPVPSSDCDAVVLAGDIARPQQAIDWARQCSVPVLYVPGNHEYYGGSLSGTLSTLRALAAGTNVHILEKNEICLSGVRFLGCTLWTDFRLEPSSEERDAAMAKASELVRDFSRIKLDIESDELLTPAVSRQNFDQSVAWLEYKFTQPFAGTTVVLSHHAPSKGSIHPKYEGSPLNGCFVSDLEQKILSWQPALWIHGHLHDSSDYQMGATRVVCNPRGYVRNGVTENPQFDPRLVIQI
ncbi:metallophosphoesterase family protein [Glaciimonas immobilis]|uniref:Icc-related predicted phosphoesterase n=1 Tax=Glaciimonas immobilis TaxID=728004 RepID=A0A840RS80_9BURK|nr:metallophosphoesterase family protein [Glaciimonas immobilis]KAF3997818.1 metallophosphoesterase [Glaciimonas immobilis]MBB5199554.1 Icc-related predicted phosphoesterase [Glaciimonas immobilis]